MRQGIDTVTSLLEPKDIHDHGVFCSGNGPVIR
jgi:hypothetical protein